VSPVPAFDLRGFLPPFLGPDETTRSRSPYQVTMVELVAGLGTTPCRCNLLFGLLSYRSLMTNLGYTDGVQFIDGSFVENVENREGRDPNDIDVFSFVVRPYRYRSNAALWAASGFGEWTTEIADRNRNKTRFGLDTFAIAIDQAHPLGLIDETIYWYSLFAHKRITHAWKGFVRIQLNSADDVAAKTALLTGP